MIVDANEDEGRVRAWVEKLVEGMGKDGGKVEKVEVWGKGGVG